MSSRPALVIGAGVAGPVMGVALVRAGIPAVVYEASPTPRDGAGVFLNLAPNGLAALRALGLDHSLEEIGFQNDCLVFHNEAGRVLAEVPVGGVTLLRGALSRALRQAAEQRGIRFEFGKSIESVDQDHGSVLARFADGTSASGRCLIGADGIHSRTRSSIFPAAAAPADTGILNAGGIVQTDLRPTGTAMHMVFGRRGASLDTRCGRRRNVLVQQLRSERRAASRRPVGRGR